MSSYYSYSSNSFAVQSGYRYKFPYRKSYGFIVFAIILLVMSWEAMKMDAAVAGGQIPEESIRLRILANSDRPADQLVKRVVRDEIVKAMNGWVSGPQTIEEARASIRENMSEIERIVANVLASRGFDYSFKAELGVVPFPTKMYGNQVYPAADYEALLITIGEGAGQNWWCVLFPPLCFIDAVSGEASAAAADTGAVKASDETPAKQPALAKTSASISDNEAPEVKFFLWEMIESIINWFKSLF